MDEMDEMGQQDEVLCVKICKTSDGQFSVETEGQAEEEQEGALPAMTTSLDGQDEGGEQKQVFATVDEALQAARDILSAGEQSPEEAKNSIMAGYNKAGNIGMRGQNG